MKSAKRDVHKNIFFCFISLQIFRHKLTGKHLIKSNNVSWQKIFFEFLISKVHKYNLNFIWHYNHNNSIFFNKKDLAISDTGCWKKTKQLTFFFSLQRLNYDPIIMKLISQCLWDVRTTWLKNEWINVLYLLGLDLICLPGWLDLICLSGWDFLFYQTARAAVVHLNFRAGSTFPVPDCTISPWHRIHEADTQRTSRCNNVDAIRL